MKVTILGWQGTPAEARVRVQFRQGSWSYIQSVPLPTDEVLTKKALIKAIRLAMKQMSLIQRRLKVVDELTGQELDIGKVDSEDVPPDKGERDD